MEINGVQYVDTQSEKAMHVDYMKNSIVLSFTVIQDGNKV